MRYDNCMLLFTTLAILCVSQVPPGNGVTSLCISDHIKKIAVPYSPGADGYKKKPQTRQRSGKRLQWFIIL
ncbi:hypothetical protein DRE43_24060 [Salmonella enterica subsp. enterica serovar Java]|nr:hypothetical protein [Salmonella enterica subsp. enterica serovar Java]